MALYTAECSTKYSTILNSIDQSIFVPTAVCPMYCMVQVSLLMISTFIVHCSQNNVNATIALVPKVLGTVWTGCIVPVTIRKQNKRHKTTTVAAKLIVTTINRTTTTTTMIRTIQSTTITKTNKPFYNDNNTNNNIATTTKNQYKNKTNPVHNRRNIHNNTKAIKNKYQVRVSSVHKYNFVFIQLTQ